MTTDQWYADNDAYLSAALRWLRLCLEHLIPVALPPPPVPVKDNGVFLFRRRPPLALPPPHDDWAESEAQARRDMQAREEGSALNAVAQRLGLSVFERRLLLLCAGMELDTRIPGLCARAQDHPQRPYPTFALALALFESEAKWDALSPQRPLRYWRLLEVHQGRAEPLSAAALRIDERILNAIKGLSGLDERLVPYLEEVTPSSGDLTASQQVALEQAVSALHRAQTAQVQEGQAPSLPVVALCGPDPESQRRLAQVLAGMHGLTLYRLGTAQLPAAAGDVDTLARLWRREERLVSVALLLDVPEEPNIQAISALCAHNAGLTCLQSRDPVPLNLRAVTLNLPFASASEQAAQWLLAVPGLDPALAEQLSQQFQLGPEMLERLASDSEPADLWNACRLASRARFDTLATRIEGKSTWADLVLPDLQLDLLRRLTEQVRHRFAVYESWGFAERQNRGLGVSALFAGESGTGKTMAAEVIAGDLALDLIRIDLAGVVSKYIGETEKNLRRIFDAAEGSGAVLLFDEADALFGKRSEVKDSHDRYANIEINYLLQRIEGYRGIAILATNIRSALDSAFTRRLRFIVNFPFPGVEERKRMWQQVYPPQVDTHLLDFGVLARFSLTGAGVQNAALASAFRAAARGEDTVRQVDALQAIRAELLKQERPISDPLLSTLEVSV